MCRIISIEGLPAIPNLRHSPTSSQCLGQLLKGAELSREPRLSGMSLCLDNIHGFRRHNLLMLPDDFIQAASAGSYKAEIWFLSWGQFPLCIPTTRADGTYTWIEDLRLVLGMKLGSYFIVSHAPDNGGSGYEPIK